MGMFDKLGAVAGGEVIKGEPKKTANESTSLWDKSLNSILTNEDSRSYFASMESGKLAITNEGVKSFVLDKLYNVVTTKISKMDVEYQEIMKTAGSYSKYRNFKLIDETVKSLKELTVSGKSRLDPVCVEKLNTIFLAHENLIKSQKDFMDAFRFNIGPVKQYYLTIVSSVIYSLGFIVTSMIDYDQRDGNASFEVIFKNENIMEKGLPKNMLNIIVQFNEDCKTNSIHKTVDLQKKTPVAKESTALIIGATAIGIMALPAIIRYVIYFFMHSKVKLAEYFEAQAAYLEINAAKLEYKGVKDAEKIAAKQMKYVEKLRTLASKFSGDKYSAEKSAQKEIQDEDKAIVKEADAAEKSASSSYNGYSDSDILL